ncbi:MAG: chorismate mutase [Patescibacteria group bacterium]|jgi:chorismate mutase
MLAIWRSDIEKIDQKLIKLIGQRLTIGKQIQDYKKLHNLPVFDATRERQLSDNYDLWIKKAKIENPGLIKDILYKLIAEIKK